LIYHWEGIHVVPLSPFAIKRRLKGLRRFWKGLAPRSRVHWNEYLLIGIKFMRLCIKVFTTKPIKDPINIQVGGFMMELINCTFVLTLE